MMRQHGALLLAGVLLLGGACAWIAAGTAPRFTSFVAAIGHVLHEQGIAHRAIFLEQRWPDSVNDLRYGAHLLVELDDGQRIAGRLECRTGQRDCRISLVALAIERQPIPDISVGPPSFWQRVLDDTRHVLAPWWPT